jgi:hypothetical protein
MKFGAQRLWWSKDKQQVSIDERAWVGQWKSSQWLGIKVMMGLCCGEKKQSRKRGSWGRGLEWDEALRKHRRM